MGRIQKDKEVQLDVPDGETQDTEERANKTAGQVQGIAENREQ